MTLKTHICIGAGCVYCLHEAALRTAAGDVHERPPMKKLSEIRAQAHFIAGSGDRGDLYDGCAVYHTYDEAVNALAATFALGRSRKGRLCAQGFLHLHVSEEGATYCEIRKCSCNEPWTHDDNMSEQEWKAGQQ